MMRDPSLMPDDFAGWLRDRQWAAAESFCASAQTDDNPRVGFWRGALSMAKGRHPEAMEWLSVAGRDWPDSSDVAYVTGVCFQRMGRLAEAIQYWQRALTLDATHPEALYNLARALAECGDDAAAADGYEQLLTIHPEHVDARYNLANRLLAMDRPYAAISCLAPLHDADPNHADAWVNSGLAHKAVGQFDAAETCYRRALAIAPDSVAAHWNLAHVLLLTDRWREGFAEYEWRLRREEAPTITGNTPSWDGAPLPDGHLLIWAEQGIGDAIQFIRYLPAVARRVDRLTLYCHESLVSLAGSIDGVDRILRFGAPIPPTTAHAPLVSLPHILGKPDPADGWSGAYVPSARSAPVASTTGKHRIGVVWAGNPTHGNDHHRSMALDDLAPLMNLPGVQWYSLQRNGGDAIDRLGWQERMVDLSARLIDFSATAALISELDLVITVDTAVAHLAGAMDRPVWMLLPHLPDWRWSLTSRRTPWYPAMRLFRQPRPHQWEPVVAEALSALTIWRHMGGSPNRAVDGPLQRADSP